MSIREYSYLKVFKFVWVFYIKIKNKQKEAEPIGL